MTIQEKIKSVDLKKVTAVLGLQEIDLGDDFSLGPI
jgi:hypothetical protein